MVTNCNAQDLPEGASPRCWDVDFVIGSCFTRAGLASVYTYTQVLTITQVVVGSTGMGTFTYTGKTPTINEAFVLSDFVGQAFFLNGQTVVVISVNPIGMTFMADVTGNAGAFTNILGTATSTTGDFLGPNVPTSAVATGTGNAWVSPANILGNTGYASVSTGASGSVNQVPLAAGSLPTSGATAFWANPTLITSTGTHITLTAGQIQDPVVAYIGTIALPANATVTGLSVTLDASCSVFGVGSINVQLVNPLNNFTPYGTAVNKPLSTVNAPYTFGSASYQWGTTLTPANVNGSDLGVMVSAVVSSGTATISVNTLAITVTYVLAGSSQALQTTIYTFTVPLTSGMTGFGVSFQAYTSNATSVTMQLLKNGIAVGQPETQILTTTPTIYQLGAATDLWGSTWLPADVNNTQFGVLITASGLGTTFINDLDVLSYISPALVNFNYIKSYIQNNGQTDTLALDASGIMWKEDVTNAPGVLATVLSGILPGSFAKSATADDNEYIVFSDLNVGTERPRVYFQGSQFLPLTQIGPGAPPSFAAASGSGASVLAITNFAISSNVVTFTYTIGPTVAQDQVYTISGAVPTYLNFTGTVLATGLTSTTFEMDLTHADVSSTPITPSATGTLQFNYPITSITQPAQQSITDSGSGSGGGCYWGAGPGPTHTPGTSFVVYYSQTSDTALNQYYAQNPLSTYVFLGNIVNFPQFSNQTYLVTETGFTKPSGTAGAARAYFMVNVGVSGNSYPDNTTGTYQQTIATVTATTAVPNLTTGSTIQITGESPTPWNNNWTIVQSLSSATLGIVSTAMSSSGVATYQYTVPIGGVQPVAGQAISITGCTNSASGYTLSPFNGIFNIATVGGGSFTVTGFAQNLPISQNSDTNGVGVTFGTTFTIDPGALTIGTANSPIYGNAGATASTAGIFFASNTAVATVTSGTRQGVVFFITQSGAETQVSPPVVFTVPQNVTSIQVSNIPIGPPDVVARGIAITEAGQNGVPGANFYVIENNVTVQVQNGAPLTFTSTIIRDNTSTTATLTFSDAVLLNSREVDIQGDNLFNLIELGSSAWAVPYASRMFYGLQLNKIDNWTSGGGLTFDSGYLPSTGNIIPLGWQSSLTSANATLITSAVTGQSLYISNTTGATIANAGLIFQTAYQDPYNVAIIQANTTYSIRVAARIPSGLTVGTLSIGLYNYNAANTAIASQFFPTWGSFDVPLTSMSTNIQVFTGTLLTSAFVGTVPPALVIAVQVLGLGAGADCEIDRIEVYPTNTPYLKAQVYGSYTNQPEAIDGSSTGGIIDTTTENAQPVMGGFVMHNLLYLLKTNSWYSVQDNPNSEPGGWGINEVSNKVGAIGINSYDVGEEWCVTACRAGIFGFNGGQPVKIMQELWNLWEQINWNAGQSIVLRNDIVSKRLYCAIPLPTGVNPATGLPANKYTNVWLPNAPYNPTPTTPNVILMLNYQGLATFEEMVNSPEVHTTISHIVLPTRKRRIESREFRESPHCGQS